MNTATAIMVVATLLGSATIGGVFFAFSSFVMTALARVPSSEGIAAMQSINVVVINRSFLGAFIGTAVLSVGMFVVALNAWGAVSAYLFLMGAGFYVIGTFLVTILGNVPLNERLAAICATDPDAVVVWERYLDRWTMLNTVRTAAAMMAALMYTLGLLTIGNA